MSNSGKLLKIASLIMITLACFFVCLHFLYWYDNKYTAKGLQPVSGMLCLSEEDLAGRQLYFLTRQWQFYPDVLLTPEDFKGKTPDIYMRYITIGEYNNFSMDNPARSTRGSATYRLLLSLPGTPRSYTLALPEIFSSYSLYIGGEKILQLGDPDPDNYLARIGNRTVSFTASGVTELLLQVTNYSHFYSGLTYPPLLGEPYAVSRLLNIRLLIALSALICTVLCGLLSLYFSLMAKQSITVRASVPVSGRVYQLSPALYLFHHKPPALVYAGASVHLRHVSADYHPAAISAGEKAPPLLRHAATAFPVLRCGHSLLPVSAPSGNTSYNFFPGVLCRQNPDRTVSAVACGLHSILRRNRFLAASDLYHHFRRFPAL